MCVSTLIFYGFIRVSVALQLLFILKNTIKTEIYKVKYLASDSDISLHTTRLYFIKLKRMYIIFCDSVPEKYITTINKVDMHLRCTVSPPSHRLIIKFNIHYILPTAIKLGINYEYFQNL